MTLSEWCKENKREYLLHEWSKKNDRTPDEVSAMSNVKVVWECPQHHEYITAISYRTNKQSGCPICSNRCTQRGVNDIGTTHPECLKEWDFGKNEVSPYTLTYGAHANVWWICEKGHSYQKTIKQKLHDKCSCPVCSGYKVLSEYNSLQATHPELISEWDYEKNTILPTEITAGNSKTKVWWICEKGHHFSATPSNRTFHHSQCPICSREAQSSFSEQMVFYYVKQYFPDAQNGNREVISPYELDVYIPSINVGIEYDGEAWHKNNKRDENKSRLCEEKSILLYRIRETKCTSIEKRDNVYECSSTDRDNLGNIISDILEKLGVYKPDIQIDRDRSKIYESYLLKKKENSIEKRFPELKKEWDYTKNGKVTPDLVSYRSDKAFWWICEKGHSYRARTADKTAGKAPCWYCSNRKVLPGYNDLGSRFPNFLEEWDYEKNTKTPQEITYRGVEKVWWICKKGHSYSQTVYSKAIDGQGCPYCSNRKVLAGFNSLAAVYPEFLKEWNFDRNSISPEEISSRSSRKVWWKCAAGHEWQAKVLNRTKENGTKCPICAKSMRRKGV